MDGHVFNFCFLEGSLVHIRPKGSGTSFGLKGSVFQSKKMLEFRKGVKKLRWNSIHQLGCQPGEYETTKMEFYSSSWMSTWCVVHRSMMTI